jgi:hypothetical protein
MPSTPSSLADAFRTTLDLFATGLDLMHQNLRRSHPTADDGEIERLLQEWLLDRPGAESGDSSGRRVEPERQIDVTSLEAALRHIHADLTEAHVSFALVGGLAVSARTEPRFTRDADLAVAVASDAEAEALIHTLRTRDYGIEAIVEQDAVGRLATVRVRRSGQPRAPVVDLLFASSGIEREVVEESQSIELLPNLTMAVARTGHLIALKVLSRDDLKRPQDLVDLRALLRVASATELARARESLALIAARGYHRGRHLEHEMKQLLTAPR